jgi:SAM-dependent methyltransferase
MEQNKLKKELESFQNIWEGGYLTGYSPKRNQKGLEDYLKTKLKGKNFLEIGCGGGQWSKFIYDLNIFNKMYCIDALSEEHNNFWSYVGDSAKNIIQYEQVKNFELNFIDDNSLDFVFSYDVFCHISLSGVQSYLSSLYKKSNKGSELLIMFADPKKYLKSEPENRYHVSRYLPKKKFIYKLSDKKLISDALKDCDGDPSEGRWYWIGIENFLKACNEIGFKVLNNDLNIDKTNPITLLKKY